MATDHPSADRALRVEFWRDDGGPLVPAEAFLAKYVVTLYEPVAGQPDEPARILLPGEFWARAKAMRDGGQWDRDVAATQALEELRCALEDAVRSGSATPRYEDGLEMRHGMPAHRPYESFGRAWFERGEWGAFLRFAAPLIEKEQPSAAPTPGAMPAGEETPTALIGPGSPLWARKCEKLRTPWSGAENGDLLRLHELLKARGVDDPTATLVAELGVSDRTIRNHLSDARKARSVAASSVVVRNGKRENC